MIRTSPPSVGERRRRETRVRTDLLHRSFHVREGAREEVEGRVEDLVGFIQQQEPQLIAYDFYIDEEGRGMTVVSVHPDSDSLALHLEVGRAAFSQFADLIDLHSIEVYGRLPEQVVALLEDKAAMLGDGGAVEGHERLAGFLRVTASSS